jgi:putative oxidoreductase
MNDWRKHDWAAVPLRLAAGIILCVAGYQKLMAMDNTVAYFTKLGFPVPVVTAWFIALLEFFGGAALILGLFVSYLGLVFTIEFIVAAFLVKLPGVGYAQSRLDIMILAAAAALSLLGAGPWSIDSVWFYKKRSVREN